MAAHRPLLGTVAVMSVMLSCKVRTVTRVPNKRLIPWKTQKS